ncbi:MAG: hypothetical protein QF554_02325 [Dehalococcoidia bacterium]|jgi:hypothetical protein|nr:hypothetical protein [Dehalococcoidia bacterium]
MTPRERRERASRNARRGPIYEGIGFGVIVLVAALIAGPTGILFMLVAGAVLLVTGLVAGIALGPAKKPGGRGDLPPT